LALAVSILWGLAAAFTLGVADFAAREAGQREGSLTTLLYVQLIGSPITFIWIFLSTDIPFSNLTSLATILGVVSGFQLIIGNLLFYQALIIGPLLIVAPITSSFAIVTILLSLLTGERPTPLQMTGIVITLTGIILAAAAGTDFFRFSGIENTRNNKTWRSSGILLAILAAILFGISFWLMKYAVLSLGSQLTVFVTRQTALVVMVIIFLVTKRSPYLLSYDSLRWIGTIAILDTGASWFINLGLQSGFASIVSVITSLYSVVTITLGYLLLRERITRSQQIGIGFTLAGVVLSSM
jgi:drug/metabolite transporter (DMT)-like permease